MFDPAWVSGLAGQLQAKLDIAVEALDKISDPRKRDHKEPDAYTTLGCVMNIANEALSRIRSQG